MSESAPEVKQKSPYFLDPKSQRRWIIDKASQFNLEERCRFYLLTRNVVGDAAIVDVGAAGIALNLDKLNDNMILTLIALALDVAAGTRLKI